MQLSFSLTKKPSTKEVINLYTRVGWGKIEDYNFPRFEKAFEKSRFVTAYDDSNLIGFVRFLSDESQDTSILEFIVHPRYQGFNIGKKMLNELIGEIGHTNIFINCVEKTKDFFLKNGFKQHQLIALSRTAVVTKQ